MKRVGMWVTLIALVYGVLEAISATGLYLVGRLHDWHYHPVDELTDFQAASIGRLLDDTSKYVMPDPELGWTIRPNGVAPLYQANSAGMRRTGEVDALPTPGVHRIAAYGDSFTHGDQVANADTWSARVEALAPEFELLNFGVGGYGVDQAYLRYQRTQREFPAELVLIGFMSENIKRHVNRYRPFYAIGTGMTLGKPRFVLRDGELELLPNPLPGAQDLRALLAEPRAVLPRIGENDHFFAHRYRANALDWSPTYRLSQVIAHEMGASNPSRRLFDAAGDYRTDSEAFQISVALIRAFVARVQADGARPLVLVFPNRGDVERFQTSGKRTYQALLEAFDAAGVDYVDLLPALTADPLDDVFNMHYTPLGNSRVAEYLIPALRARLTP